MFSGSGDVREMEWARLASQSEYAENICCPYCEKDLGHLGPGSMSVHLEKPENATFLQYAGKSGDPKLRKIFEMLHLFGLHWLAHAVANNSPDLNLQQYLNGISCQRRTLHA